MRKVEEGDLFPTVMVWIDPPSGWRYGFPKSMPKSEYPPKDFNQWLLDNGYPQKAIDSGGNYYRYWEEIV